jgi:EAL domain-containing protein (putative c-di-GMP-specific phosphodiesterase class I)
MRSQANARLEIEEQIRGGLERGEFLIYYQPIDSLKSGEIVGFEALLRWAHPVRGMLLPAEFLQIAEESGLIVPLGEWVLEKACCQLKTWQQQYAHLQHATIGVNLSSQQFSQPHLAENITNALRVSGLDGRYLRLEIGERALVGRDAMTDAVIATLADLGVQLQIDDFWTGSSALAYLQHFPVQALKMDRSFVHRMMQDRKGLGFVRAIVTMATDLGIDSVAEGIETPEQLDELKALSCGFGQGYLLAEPMDADSLEKVLARPKEQNSAR